ncbi:hypothetical protein NUW58_g10600 [Xylaria curta]|uniref:Uncharacterized protein n=1 Tax=Xylaria curta TaxID=42375 RepID=A0ACC1MIN3_9PEZI|nr:hypothetical protein NUW58_g10600 [Xylaria curta]
MASPAWSTLSALPRLDTSSVPSPPDSSQQHRDTREIRSAKEARQLPHKPSGSFLSSTANTLPVARTDDGASTPDLFRSVADALGVDTNELPQPFYGVPWARDEDDEDDYHDDDLDHGRDYNEKEEKDGGGDMHGGVHETSSTFIRQPAVIPTHHDRNNSTTSLSPFSQSYHTMAYGREPIATEPSRSIHDLPIRSSSELHSHPPRPIHSLVEPAWKSVITKDTVVGRDSRAVPAGPDERNGNKLNERESMTPLSPLPPSGRLRLSSVVSPLEPSSPESSVKSPRFQGPVYSSPPAIPHKASRRLRNDVEQTLASESGVSRAVVVRPKAGLFEGRLVALLTLSDSGPRGSDRSNHDDSEIKLQNAYYTRNLPSIRRAVESQLSLECVPSVWIALEKMPLDGEGQALDNMGKATL